MMNQIREMNSAEMERTVGGVTHPVDGLVDLYDWVTCGFHHNYRYTGKTQNRLDFLWHVTFYQRICKDCGHVDWTRSAP